MKVVTGIRRCGKSYLVFELFKEHLLGNGVAQDHIIEMAFDEYGNTMFRDPTVFYPYIKEHMRDDSMYYILLDEVQLLDDFESVLIGLARMRNADVYVTGSNARFLSRDIITEFRGRGDEIRMLPLSFSEFMSAFSGDERSGYDEYISYGGLPAAFGKESPEEKVAYLKGLLDEIYIRDIVERNGVRNVDDMEDLLDVLSSGNGSLTNPKRISDTFKSEKHSRLSPETVANYLEHLGDAFIVEKAKHYDDQGVLVMGIYDFLLDPDSMSF